MRQQHLRGQREGVLRGLTLKIEFLEFLDTREQELPIGFYPSKNIVRACIYTTCGKFQSHLLKKELQTPKPHRFLDEIA